MKHRPLRTYNIHEAKTHLSKLLEQAVGGAEVIIAKAGVPIARLVPVTLPAEARQLGTEQGLIVIADDFDGPLPDNLLEAFEG
jgi:prevent-host-death family protein